MRVIKGNAVDALLTNQIDFLLHCCNNRKIMGSGIAKEIKQRIPSAYSVYMNSSKSLGEISCAEGVVNMVAQDGFGNLYKYVDYGAFAECLAKFCRRFESRLHRSVVGVPYKIASDRAGGDWMVIREILEFYATTYNFEIIAYSLTGEGVSGGIY